MKSSRGLVQGVGVNDADYPVSTWISIDGRQSTTWRCPIYQAWKSMLRRCHSPKLKAKYPTYMRCTVSPEWHSFSAFRGWMLTQDWEGKQLDKDIITPGNKVYSPETCVLVSAQINSFMLDGGAARGEWPIGVCWSKSTGKFQSQCKNPFTGKSEYLGVFADPNEAHEAWRARKHELALAYADMQVDPRIAMALRTRFSETGVTA